MAHCKYCKQDIRLGGAPHRCAEGDAAANGERNARRSAADCSRFPAARVEELLQASNDLSEGDEIIYEDARDLALYALDELERVRNVYQSRFMDIANAAVTAMRYPSENS
jgi:hypothetical protein